MRKTGLSLIILFVLCASCRKPHTCVCSTLQPNIKADTNIVFIDNNERRAFSICSSMNLTVVNTTTISCFIKE